MNKIQKNRLMGFACLIVLLSAAAGLTLYALKQNINLFYTPTELLALKSDPTHPIRLGGYVKTHSVHFSADGQAVTFIVTDRTQEIHVTYQGVLPNLFREGQTVVVTGRFILPATVNATEVLAKHDERYMPRAIANSLQQKGGT